MTSREYDLVFVGGGLAALLLLQELRTVLPARVAVVDPCLPQERLPVHWSYWSHEQTPYDRFAVGVWRRARVADTPPEPIAPFALRLVRSTEMIAHIEELLGSVPIEWLHTAVRSITRRDDGLYEVGTDTGIHVEADRPVFDAATATLFDPLDERSFAYLLPLSPVEALLESASFGPVALEEDQTPLLRYLRARHPEAGFQVTHAESGAIPLVFAPPKTTGPRHIPLGTKRGLIKPS